MNKCYQCDSTSVIQDGKIWVCFNHIKLCACGRHGSSVESFSSMHDGFDFTGSHPKIPQTIRDMAMQANVVDSEESETE